MKYTLSTFHGTHLGASRENRVFLVSHCREWEFWELRSNSNGTVSLQSSHGTFLRGYPGRSVDLAPYSYEWEQWTKEQLENGKYALRSHHGTYLTATPEGKLGLIHHSHWREWWNLNDASGVTTVDATCYYEELWTNASGYTFETTEERTFTASQREVCEVVKEKEIASNQSLKVSLSAGCDFQLFRCESSISTEFSDTVRQLCRVMSSRESSTEMKTSKVEKETIRVPDGKIQTCFRRCVTYPGGVMYAKNVTTCEASEAHKYRNQKECIQLRFLWQLTN